MAKFTLPKLPYSYDALEPYIDAETMRIHHTKHHQAYVDNLNLALDAYPKLQDKSLEELLKGLNKLPSSIQKKVQNHGGGHLNHSFFWQLMGPSSKATAPKGKLLKAIEREFGGHEAFKEKFAQTALGHFGSGWAWLSVNKGKLVIEDSANQDTPLSSGYTPILTLDVWEHAYYLKYQNRRAEYIGAWWNVVNWNQVVKNFSKLT